VSIALPVTAGAEADCVASPEAVIDEDAGAEVEADADALESGDGACELFRVAFVLTFGVDPLPAVVFAPDDPRIAPRAT
jgi:hypothetical protein